MWDAGFSLNPALLSETYSGGSLTGLTVTNVYDTLLRRTTNGLWNGSTWLAQSGYTYNYASHVEIVGADTRSATYGYLANSPLVEQIVFKEILVQLCPAQR